MDAIQASFDCKLKVEFHGTKVTSDAGLPAYIEALRLYIVALQADNNMSKMLLTNYSAFAEETQRF